MPEVSDRDDDQQVESHCEQRDAREQDVKDYGLSTMLHWLPAGSIQELWKAEFSSFQGLHNQRENRRREAAELWQLCHRSPS